MLDMKFIRENPDLLKQAISKRHYSFDLEILLKIDEARRALIKEVEALREEQNKASENFLPAGRQGSKDKLDDLKQLKESLQKKEAEFSKIDEEFRRLMLLVPNIPDPTVPEGKSERITLRSGKSANPKISTSKSAITTLCCANLTWSTWNGGQRSRDFVGIF